MSSSTEPLTLSSAARELDGKLRRYRDIGFRWLKAMRRSLQRD